MYTPPLSTPTAGKLCHTNANIPSNFSGENTVLCSNLSAKWSFKLFFFGAIIGASLSEPHINSTAMLAIYGICIYVCMVCLSSARRFIDSVQGRMQSFVLKSLRSKTTVTACSNLAHLCNISLVVSRLSEAML